MADKKVSMADIARLSGVSVATVSRILNKNGRYSADTEQKVNDTIKKYGYRINLSAKALRTSRSQSIGVIVPDITNEFFAKIVRAIENYLSGLDYTLFVCDTNEDGEAEKRQISHLVSKDVDGIILISGKTDVKMLYDKYDIPVVYIDRRPENAGNLVISDNEKGGYLGAKALTDKGCRRILYLRDHRRLSPIEHRLKGYKNALIEAGIEFDESLVIDVKVDYGDARAKTEKLIKDGFSFDGIFASSDMIAIGALHAVLAKGLRIPEDVKLVGFDDITASQICNPPLTTVHQDTEMFGKYSVDRLFELMSGEKSKNEVIIVDVELRERSTT